MSKREIGAKAGEVGFYFPEEKDPPKATKLLIIQRGGCLIVSDWQDGLQHEQWSHPPKKRKRAEPTESVDTLYQENNDVHL